MSYCAHCGDEIHGEPFHCNICGYNYCIRHKEPENHDCNIVRESSGMQQSIGTPSVYEQEPQVLSITQGQTYQQPSITGPTRGTTNGTYTWYRQESQVPTNAFDPGSGIEFKGILLPHMSELFHFFVGVSLIFIVGILTFLPNLPQLIALGYEWAIFMLAGFYATAFFFHELGHRQVAKHFKLQTKFRLLKFGMLLTVIGVLFNIYSLTSGGGSFPSFALPGAVVVLGLSTINRTTGLCKTAGPLVNLIYGLILFTISFLIPDYPLNMLIGLAANLNFMLGTFNMIPVGILDGQNIWKWNKKIYIALCGSLLTLLIITYIIIYAPPGSNPYFA